MKTIYAVENYGNDSRVRLHYNGIVQSLNARMGTGGGNVPMVLITVTESHYDDFHEDSIANTLRASNSTQGGGVMC